VAEDRSVNENKSSGPGIPLTTMVPKERGMSQTSGDELPPETHKRNK